MKVVKNNSFLSYVGRVLFPMAILCAFFSTDVSAAKVKEKGPDKNTRDLMNILRKKQELTIRKDSLIKANAALEYVVEKSDQLPVNESIRSMENQIAILKLQKDSLEKRYAERDKWMKGYLPKYLADNSVILSASAMEVSVDDLGKFRESLLPFESLPEASKAIGKIDRKIALVNRIWEMRTFLDNFATPSQVAEAQVKAGTILKELTPAEAVAFKNEISVPLSHYTSGLELFRKIIDTVDSDPTVEMLRKDPGKPGSYDYKDNVALVAGIFDKIAKNEAVAIGVKIKKVPYLAKAWNEYNKRMHSNPLDQKRSEAEAKILSLILSSGE